MAAENTFFGRGHSKKMQFLSPFEIAFNCSEMSVDLTAKDGVTSVIRILIDGLSLRDLPKFDSF